MLAEFVERAEGWVLGTMTRIQPTAADYRALWEQGFMPHHEAIRSRATDSGYYGVYYGTGEEGLVDFVAGMSVDKGVEVPGGLTLRPMPAGLYAKFLCSMQEIGPTWRRIYSEWLPASDYREDAARPAMEYFAPEAMEPGGRVTILLPVRSK